MEATNEQAADDLNFDVVEAGEGPREAVEMADWHEHGGFHQVPVLTVSTGMVMGSLVNQIKNMDALELAWLKRAAENIAKLCLEEIQKQSSEDA